MPLLFTGVIFPALEINEPRSDHFRALSQSWLKEYVTMMAFLRKIISICTLYFQKGEGTLIPYPYSSPPSGIEVMSDYTYGTWTKI